jgi:amidophosphoribosyltransferase
VAATRVKKQSLCRACFDGVYPVELPLSERVGRSPLPNLPRADADGLLQSAAGVGAADALSRP